MQTSIQSIISQGSQGVVVDIECHLSNNLPTIVIVGFANRAVDEAKERLRGAFANSNLEMPRKRITLNLAPADIPKADSSFDMAMSIAILCASRQVLSHGSNNPSILCDVAFIGEFGLDGRTRAVRGIIGKLLAGRSRGITTFYVPAANMAQARLIPGITLYSVATLRELAAHFYGDQPLPAELTNIGSVSRPKAAATLDRPPQLSLDDVIGQDTAKRALEICAAGGHNVLLHGPPGTGKSMLAKALASILPDMNHEEVLEVTHLHSLASHNYSQIITERPFRAPHHSASHTSIIGGGSQLRPGEISLAHRGVLLLDEFPEFSRPAIEALRQPLEDRTINIARAKESMQFPADVMLVATANPCPCGYANSGNPTQICKCSQAVIGSYQQKLSGPIMDRIDLFCHVDTVEHRKLLARGQSTVGDVKKRVNQARLRQAQRFGNSQLNAGMSNADIRKLAQLSPAAKKILDISASELKLSARAYMRSIKVARTIADLDDADGISPAHLAEALSYRSKITSPI